MIYVLICGVCRSEVEWCLGCQATASRDLVSMKGSNTTARTMSSKSESLCRDLGHRIQYGVELYRDVVNHAAGYMSGRCCVLYGAIASSGLKSVGRSFWNVEYGLGSSVGR
jgi:hypothetical protein